MSIRETLFSLRDEKFAAFQARLIPNVAPERIIGVRTPALRKLAKTLRGSGEAEEFLKALPHDFFEENNLHAFLLCEMKDFDACVQAVEDFLPYVDNWATCDQMSPGVFRKNKQALLPYIRCWIASERCYTRRFGTGMLMSHFLDEDFREEYLRLVSDKRSEEYYVNMMIAWYFATALAKQYEAALPYLENRRLDPWVHNKTIQKAVESFRVSDEHKACLRALKIR
ncbi:MAG: DNA alkylation repair protein [Candidatus Limivicinus sp.]|nr:DNA alkylation repair protein [Clostridiales bacterium]MDY6133604.1 DNA alkylation repair protein [Candidatus Limivicinus sp.]